MTTYITVSSSSIGYRKNHIYIKSMQGFMENQNMQSDLIYLYLLVRYNTNKNFVNTNL